MELAWIAAFATALCFGVSAIYEDRAAKQTASTSTATRTASRAATSTASPTASRAATSAAARPSLLHVVTRLPYLLGMGLSLVGWALSMLALQRLPLFAVQAIGASSIGVVVVLHRLLTHEPVPRRQAVLLAVLGVGLAALAAAAEPGEPKPVSVRFDIAIWIGVGLVAVLGLAAMRAKGDRASSLLGMVSGLAYGGTALCARALETDHTLRGLVLNSLTIALLPFAVLGITMFAAALQRGAVSVATATQHATMTVVPAAVGLIALGDHARSGMVALAWAGFALTVGAVLALTVVVPAPTATHAATTVGVLDAGAR